MASSKLSLQTTFPRRCYRRVSIWWETTSRGNIELGLSNECYAGTRLLYAEHEELMLVLVIPRENKGGYGNSLINSKIDDQKRHNGEKQYLIPVFKENVWVWLASLFHRVNILQIRRWASINWFTKRRNQCWDISSGISPLMMDLAQSACLAFFDGSFEGCSRQS